MTRSRAIWVGATLVVLTVVAHQERCEAQPDVLWGAVEWNTYYGIGGSQIQQSLGKLLISVPVAPPAPCPWMPDDSGGLDVCHTGLKSSVYTLAESGTPTGQFEVAVNFRVLAGSALPCLMLGRLREDGDSPRCMGVFYRPSGSWAGYYTLNVDNEHAWYLPWASPFGDERYVDHRLRLVYEPRSTTCTAYVDNVKLFSNQDDLSSARVYVCVMASPSTAPQSQVQFDGFRIEPVPPCVDLYDAGLSTVTPQGAAPGQEVWVQGWIDSSGGCSPGTVRVDYYASPDATITPSDTWIGQTSVYMSAGASVRLEWRGVPPRGMCYIGWIIDPGNLIPETNESNNTGSVQVCRPDAARILYVDDDARGSSDGTSWANAYRYLQDALGVAARGWEIRIAQGLYKPDRDSTHAKGTGDRAASFLLQSGVIVKGGYAGAGHSNPDERDPNTYVTILSGDLASDDAPVKDPNALLSDPTRAENSHHVVTYTGTDDTTALDGLTITCGQATGVNPGGAMYGYGGNVAVRDCLFTLNCSASMGGAVHNDAGSPTFTDCTFTWNAGELGGALANVEGQALALTNCFLAGNVSAWSGGALYNECLKAKTGPMLLNCVFSGNRAVDRGGAIESDGGGAPTLVNCTLHGNSGSEGGGLAYHEGGQPKLTNCILWGNRDAFGDDERAQLVGGPAIVDHCCIQGWTGRFGGVGNWGDDPLLADPDGQDDISGSDDDDLRPLPASACIDSGDDSAVAGVPTDMDGRPRIVDGDGDGSAVVDRGAYEWQGGYVVSQYPYSEGFEKGFGQWVNVTQDDMDWHWHSGPTPSSGTGPSAAHEGTYYLYVEASDPGYPHKVAVLRSPVFSLARLGDAELRFAYHMYGSGMGTLAVEISNDNGQTWTEQWRRAGDQGDSWHDGTIDLSRYAGSMILVNVVAVTGTGYRSDIAIDDVAVVGAAR